MSKIITIAQQKGGSGKTTIAAHLAAGFISQGISTTIFDIDPQASLSTWFRVREEKSPELNSLLSCIAIDGNALESEIAKCDDKIIIIDSPPHIQNDARYAIRAADLVIIPVQPSPTDLWATRATVEICGQENVDFKIALNRVTVNSKIGLAIRKVFENSMPNNILKNQLGNRVNFASTMLDGQTALEQSYTSASGEADAMVEEVLEILNRKKLKKAA